MQRYLNFYSFCFCMHFNFKLIIAFITPPSCHAGEAFSEERKFEIITIIYNVLMTYGFYSKSLIINEI